MMKLKPHKAEMGTIKSINIDPLFDLIDGPPLFDLIDLMDLRCYLIDLIDV